MSLYDTSVTILLDHDNDRSFPIDHFDFVNFFLLFCHKQRPPMI